MKYLDDEDIKKIKNLAGSRQGFSRGGEAGGMNLGNISSRTPDSEFAGHRSHNAGEGSRFIDWKAYARNERLYVKDFLQERRMGWEIFFDASASMGFSGEYSRLFVKFALYACGILLLRGEKLNLHLLREKKTVSSPSLRGFEKLIILDEFFSSAEFSGGNFEVETFAGKAAETGKNCRMAFFSDLFFPREKLRALAAVLAANPREKTVFHFFEKDLGKIISSAGEVLLSDAETGEELAFEYSGFRKILEEKHEKWLSECRAAFSLQNTRYFRVSEEGDVSSLRRLTEGRRT